MKTLLTAIVFALVAITSANADAPCMVNSPDGELNVRDLTPNGPGKVTDVLKNGYVVTVRDFYLLKGKSWARVVDGKTKSRVVGWVYRDYLNCDVADVAPAPKSPSVAASQAPTRPMTTAKVLLQKCESREESAETFCDGFVTAVFQTLWTLQEADQPLACMVPNVTSGYAIDLAMDYIRRNKNVQDSQAALAVINAVANKYGTKCPRS